MGSPWAPRTILWGGRRGGSWTPGQCSSLRLTPVCGTSVRIPLRSHGEAALTHSLPSRAQPLTGQQDREAGPWRQRCPRQGGRSVHREGTRRGQGERGPATLESGFSSPTRPKDTHPASCQTQRWPGGGQASHHRTRRRVPTHGQVAEAGPGGSRSRSRGGQAETNATGPVRATAPHGTSFEGCPSPGRDPRDHAHVALPLTVRGSSLLGHVLVSRPSQAAPRPADNSRGAFWTKEGGHQQ